MFPYFSFLLFHPVIRTLFILFFLLTDTTKNIKNLVCSLCLNTPFYIWIPEYSNITMSALTNSRSPALSSGHLSSLYHLCMNKLLSVQFSGKTFPHQIFSVSVEKLNFSRPFALSYLNIAATDTATYYSNAYKQ